MECDAFYSLKYADDTTFCKPCSVGSDPNSISDAIDGQMTTLCFPTQKKTDLMSTSLSYSNNFDENISLVNIMIQPSDQKIKFEAILNTKFLSAIADDILMRKLKSFGRNSDGFKTFLHLLYKICFALWGSCLE